ncbi:SDR family oxidoreductase [Lolliginicoccus suaedae]|uniref:SDR family oxidoreductase n=1 Tax=Lolliginicoccus suaedae TaxID=2605429 RepID=UPI0011EC6414|nr:SDR family oxidoreductase [Lolliginicoccus suaedae]
MPRYPALSLDGATVIVTGGARGIGAATARAFSEHGATVWIGDLDASLAEQTAATLDNTHAAHLDVTSPESWAAFTATVIEHSGSVDVLVNNAGIMPLGPFLDQADALSRLMIDINVHGPSHGTRAVLPGMLERRRGHIVTVASMAGKLPIPGMAMYNASKFAAVGLSSALRAENARTGVSFSCVMPSAVRTELSSGARLGGALPTVDPEDVAREIVRTVRTRAAEVSVPRFVHPAVALMHALVPEPIERIGRALINDRRALDQLDHHARRPYEDRIASQLGGHS